MKDALIEIYERDILKLKDEISKYKDNEKIWAIAPGISNPGGNLALHLVGNLNHFFGAKLGNNGYKRERDKEFSLKNIPPAQLMSMIDHAKEVVVNTLSAMNENDFLADFPEAWNGKVHRTDFMLLHLLAHLNYHLGQVNYHRRLLEN